MFRVQKIQHDANISIDVIPNNHQKNAYVTELQQLCINVCTNLIWLCSDGGVSSKDHKKYSNASLPITQ